MYPRHIFKHLNNVKIYKRKIKALCYELHEGKKSVEWFIKYRISTLHDKVTVVVK